MGMENRGSQKKSSGQNVNGTEKRSSLLASLPCIHIDEGWGGVWVEIDRGEMAAGMMKGKAWGVGMRLMIMVVVISVCEVQMAAAAQRAKSCKEERRLLINACKAVVYGNSPTPACCATTRDTHLQCVCAVITPKLAALVDVSRLVAIVKGCGKKLPHHYKCGSMCSPFPLLSLYSFSFPPKQQRQKSYKCLSFPFFSFFLPILT